MGRYYGICNVTKGESVSSYWKGYPPCINQVMYMIKLYGWDNSDYIVSGAYDACSIFSYERQCWLNEEEEIKEEEIKEEEIKEEIKEEEIKEEEIKKEVVYEFSDEGYDQWLKSRQINKEHIILI